MIYYYKVQLSAGLRDFQVSMFMTGVNDHCQHHKPTVNKLALMNSAVQTGNVAIFSFLGQLTSQARADERLPNQLHPSLP